MNNGRKIGDQPQVCLHCMRDFVIGGKCRTCGKPNTDTARSPNALPFGYTFILSQSRCYQIGRVLGNGGFGITYLAWDMVHSRPVAIKELFPNRLTRDLKTMEVKAEEEQLAMFQHFQKRFVDEARTLSSLRNEPEIVNIYDFFEANGTGYYAMEYLQGMDLQHWLDRKGAPLIWRELESPTRQILQGLKVIHGYGLLHRDISPDNIFVCNDGRVKLIDFGSVRSVTASHFTTILKRGFAPQELFLEKGNQGFWTDTFSLCATLYYLLSNNYPAQIYDRIPQIMERGEDPLIPLSHYSPAAPAHVVNAVMQGLQVDEKKRFQNTDEMKRALFPETSLERGAPRSMLCCVSGTFAGRYIPLPPTGYISLGRGGSNTIAYPTEIIGISRRHCVFYAHANGRLYVQDQGSTNGTYLDQRRLEPLKWYEFLPGHSLRVGKDIYIWKKQMTGGAQ